MTMSESNNLEEMTNGELHIAILHVDWETLALDARRWDLKCVLDRRERLLKKAESGCDAAIKSERR